jgi:hypothetical protein
MNYSLLIYKIKSKKIFRQETIRLRLYSSKFGMVNFIVLVYKRIDRQAIYKIYRNKERKRLDGDFKTTWIITESKMSSSTDEKKNNKN